MNQPPPDNALNFPGRPHLIFIPRATPPLSRSSGSRLAEPKARAALGSHQEEDWAPHPVDGSLGHEGADLFSTPGQAAGFREAQKSRTAGRKHRGKANKKIRLSTAAHLELLLLPVFCFAKFSLKM